MAMTKRQALRVAREAIMEMAKPLAERANRYHLEPGKWAELSKDYETYQRYMQALRVIEDEMLGQSSMTF